MFPLIDDINKIIYFWSPKCGCTSLKYFYASAHPTYKLLDLTNPNTILSYHVIDNDSINKYKQYKKYLIVRNPYSRLVSTFLLITLDKYWEIEKYINSSKEEWIKFIVSKIFINQNINDNPPKKEIINFQKKLSFRTFVEMIFHLDINNIDFHIAPQSQIINCPINYLTKNSSSSSENNNIPEVDTKIFDEIIPLEKLSKKLKILNNKFKMDGKIRTIGKHDYDDSKINMCDVNIIDHYVKNNFYPMWYHFYDNDLADKVKTLYKNDFNLLSKIYESDIQKSIENI